MRTILALLATPAVFHVQAYVPPADQADGIYSVKFDARGQAITKRHEDALSHPLSAKFRRELSSVTPANESRDFPSQQPVCAGRCISNHHDYSVVQSCLGTWLNQNTGSTQLDWMFYCRSGDTVLALCSYPDNVYGSSAEIDNFNGVMDRTCGSWKSGYVWIPDWNKSVRIMFC